MSNAQELYFKRGQPKLLDGYPELSRPIHISYSIQSASTLKLRKLCQNISPWFLPAFSGLWIQAIKHTWNIVQSLSG